MMTEMSLVHWQLNDTRHVAQLVPALLSETIFDGECWISRSLAKVWRQGYG
jgi:hypothetical protein